MKSLLAVILLATPLVLTSCEGALDDVLGEWSRPTPGNNNNNNNNNNNTNTTLSTDMTNKYRVWNGSDYDTPDIPSTAIDASTITTTINAGFYDVKGDVNLSGTITLAGDAEFLLRDGATLKISGAIVDNTGTYNLKIYAQSEGTGMGKLDITSSGTVYPISVNKLTVHGGEIIATNTDARAVNLTGGLDILGGKLIASGKLYGISVSGGIVNVVNGTVDAKSTQSNSRAISLDPADFIILGGNVKATTAGNNGSCLYVNGNMTVYDGEIDAQSTGPSYGIRVFKKLTVSGGNITAISGDGSVTNAIFVYEMEVSGGTINAIAGAGNQGIYVQSYGTATPVFVVSGGNITAKGGDITTGNAGYGIAVNGSSKITGGTINATGGDATTGYAGHGFVSNGITVSGGTLTATGGAVSGNSRGGDGIVGQLIISGGSVEATGGTGGTTSGKGGHGIASGAANAISYSGGNVIAKGATGAGGAGYALDDGNDDNAPGQKIINNKATAITYFTYSGSDWITPGTSIAAGDDPVINAVGIKIEE